ncbi:MAG TPA: hypothetical protein VNL74_06725 [Methylococcus sp.]|nr:hypothetical protein [Methylococcus sp.]
MRRSRFPVAAIVLLTLGGSVAPGTVLAGRQHDSVQNPCAAPNKIVSSIEETAWRIWVAATCPVNDDQYPFVVWENWIEQSQLYPPDPSQGLKVPNSGGSAGGHPLHESPLALARNPALRVIVPAGEVGAPDTGCNKAQTPPPNQPNLVLCEEVRINGAAEDYIAGTGFWNRTAQALAASVGDSIQFPRPAVEIKADWILLSSIGASCDDPSAGVHVEKINGNCYALAGMHLISKLIDQWIWATFEPQNSLTNPNRCKVLGCFDPFGSKPARSNGEPTQLTRKLEALMNAANLAPEWKNYRLDGVQTGFFKPKLLGNSIIEGENAGVPLTQSSCISCHAVSSVKSDGTEGINLLTSNPFGFPKPLPSDDWIRRDFVWSLGLACPNGPAGTNQVGSLQDCAR